MSDISKNIRFEWSYLPKDFWGGKTEFTKCIVEQCNFVLVDGKAYTKIDSEIYDSDPTIHEQLSQQLESWFCGAQVTNRKSFELSGPMLYHPDGQRSLISRTGHLHVSINFLPFDVIIRDEKGNIIKDSKQKRVEEQKRTAELFAKVRHLDEGTTDRIHKSFILSTLNSGYELNHLYDIREALKNKFSSDRKARNKLKITKRQWSKLGILTNKRTEGRHREGRQDDGQLYENITEGELDEVREIARNMMIKYFEHLEKSIHLSLCSES